MSILRGIAVPIRQKDTCKRNLNLEGHALSLSTDRRELQKGK